MTQAESVLSMLRRAGKRGVRSDAFLNARIPRAAARILELKDAGHEIVAEREGKYVRYELVGHRAGGRGEPRTLASGAANAASSSVSGETSPGSPASPGEAARLFDSPTPPSAYDPWSEAA